MPKDTGRFVSNARCVLTMPLIVEKWQEDIIEKRFEMCRSIYNAMLGYELKKYRAMLRDPQYQEVQATILEYYKADTKKTPEYKAAATKRTEIIRQYGLSEFTFISDVAMFSKHFQENITATVASASIASPMWRAFDKLLYGNGNTVHFKKKGSVTSVKSTAKAGIRLKEEVDEQGRVQRYITYGNKRDFPKKCLKLKMKAPETLYEKEMLSLPVKQIGIVAMHVRGKNKYYAQLCLDGVPAIRYNQDGEIKNPIGSGRIGMFIDTDTITICTDEHSQTFDLTEGIPSYAEQIKELQRKMDMSRRISNPENFNADGTFKNGIRTKNEIKKLQWTFSNNYYKYKAQVADLKRKEAAIRKLHHHQLANHILSYGDELYVNDYDFKFAAMRKTEDEFHENGVPKSKKKKGVNVSNNAPALLLSIIDSRLVARGYQKIERIDLKQFPEYEEIKKKSDFDYREYWAKRLHEL